MTMTSWDNKIGEIYISTVTIGEEGVLHFHEASLSPIFGNIQMYKFQQFQPSLEVNIP